LPGAAKLPELFKNQPNCALNSFVRVLFQAIALAKNVALGIDTLIVDHDGVYDPKHPNDRLILGLKGTMSEVELSMFRQR